MATELGAHRAGAMDLGAACTGFLSALALAAAQVEGGRADNVLVIGADVLSRFIDRGDRGTAGDLRRRRRARPWSAPANGAGGRIGDIVLRCDGAGRALDPRRPRRGADPHAGPRHLQGGGAAAVRVHARGGGPRPGSSLDEIDLFVYHQANIRILRAVAEQLELDESRVIDCIDRYGNTLVRHAPDRAVRRARARDARRGDTVLLAAFGAGFTWGAGVIEWGA